MARMTRNILKGVITSIFGVVTMVVTLFLVFTDSMDFIWEGLAGLGFGTLLLLAPDTIVKQLGNVIKMVGMNKSGAVSANAEQKAADVKQDKIDNPDKQ